MVAQTKGIARAREIYQDRPRRAKELKGEGKKIVGYLCIYTPSEIMTALDIVPYRIFGDMKEPTTEADRALPAAFCPIMRSCLHLGLKGRYDFLDGMVVAHSCDAQEKTVHVWECLMSPPYFHFLDVPGTAHEASQDYFKERLNDLKKTLESFAGKELSPEKLKRAIETHNQQRSLAREMYELTKADPPLVSGTEILQVIKALMSIPVEEGNELLKQVIAEVKERKDGPQKKPARLLIWGSTIGDTSLIEIMESQANLVVDDHCGGTRAYSTDVELTEDPMDGLAYHYLVELKCPRTYMDAVYGATSKDYMADLESRFGYLKEYVKGWNVNGVVLQSVRYCDCHGFETPQVIDYFDSLGLPNTYLEHDYSEGALAPLRTRVQAFVEMIGL